MDELSKLHERNQQNKEKLYEENKISHFIFISGTSPLIVYFYEAFYSASSVEPVWAMVQGYVFTLLLIFFGSDLVIKHWFRVILLGCSHVWFCYYWVIENETRVAFLPLGIVMVLWSKWFYWSMLKDLRKNV